MLVRMPITLVLTITESLILAASCGSLHIILSIMSAAVIPHALFIYWCIRFSLILKEAAPAAVCRLMYRTAVHITAINCIVPCIYMQYRDSPCNDCILLCCLFCEPCFCLARKKKADTISSMGTVLLCRRACVCDRS